MDQRRHVRLASGVKRRPATASRTSPCEDRTLFGASLPDRWSPLRRSAFVLAPVVLVLALGLAGTSDAGADGGADAGPAREPDAAAGSRRRNFFELGLAARVASDPRERADPDDERAGGVTLTVSGALYFGRFFLESLGEGAGPLNTDALNVGVTLSERAGLALELLLASVSGIPGENVEDVEPTAGDVERDAYLLDRGTLVVESGLRLTRYAGDWINQLRLVQSFTESAGEAGVDGSLRIGRQWLAQKWLLRGIAGLHYVSSETNRAIWGIASEAASSRFPRHDAGAGIDVDLELGAARPLARDWVLRSALRLRVLSAAARGSPLADDDYQGELVTGISYVF